MPRKNSRSDGTSKPRKKQTNRLGKNQRKRVNASIKRKTDSLQVVKTARTTPSKTKTKTEYYAGIDLHKKFMQMAVMDPAGNIIYEQRIECNKDTIKAKFTGMPENTKYVLESSSVWYWVYRLLTDELNLDVTLSNPYQTRLIAESKKKTDKIDARILADLLRCDYIAKSHVPDVNTVKDRQLVRARAQFVKERARFKNLIHGILLQDGIHIDGATFSNKYIKQLRKLDNWRINHYLDTISHLDRHITDCDVMVRMSRKDDEDAKLLTTIPGIGDFTALTVSSAIDGIERFHSSDRLLSYFGLVSSTRASADTMRQGRITKTGNSQVRQLLTEAVLVHLMVSERKKKDTPISVFYKRLASKRGGSKAKVAAAAKMLMIIWWMLYKKIDFETCIKEGRQSIKNHVARKNSRKITK